MQIIFKKLKLKIRNFKKKQAKTEKLSEELDHRRQRKDKAKGHRGLWLRFWTEKATLVENLVNE